MPGNSYIASATGRLTIFVNDALSRSLETIRIARAAHALLLSGIAGSDDLIQRAINFFARRQRPDGGWSDPEETAWAIRCISLVRGQNDTSVQSALQWTNGMRKSGGGWGIHARDQARIRTTALISALMPTVIKVEDIDWLLDEWRKDFAGPVQLSYKAGFFLLSMPSNRDNDLIGKTISHLAEDQNDDGGFGPWKGHPIGSDPWSTGVVLWGLSKWIDHVDTMVIEKALDWLRKTQLPSGYWPYHYLDDGTSLALIGAVSAMKALATKE